MGWIPDLPDPRDNSYQHDDISSILQQVDLKSRNLPEEVDLRFGDEGEEFFSEVEDQGVLNSSTSFAILSLVEYFERRLHGRTFEGSKLFLYKVTCNLRCEVTEGISDIGSDIRTTFKALRRFGVPDESIWPYLPERFYQEPTSFAYQAARRFHGHHYFRINASHWLKILGSARTDWELYTMFLASGFPIVFGFSVPSSISFSPDIPRRPELDTIRGGQTALAVGYSLHHYGRGQHALRLRSSWGTRWGEAGEGWISASAFTDLAGDCWCLIPKGVNEFEEEQV